LVENANLSRSIYAIGIAVSEEALCFEDPLCLEEVSGETVFFSIGTGFAAHYPNTLWTNAHVARGILDALEGAADENPAFLPIPLAVRAGTEIGGVYTYRLNMDRLLVHPEYDEEAEASPDPRPDRAPLPCSARQRAFGPPQRV
jgi:hypothetical protein